MPIITIRPQFRLVRPLIRPRPPIRPNKQPIHHIRLIRPKRYQIKLIIPPIRSN